MVALLCRSEITVGTDTSELGSLNAMGKTASWEVGAKWQYLITKYKVDFVTTMDSRVKTEIRTVWLRDLCVAFSS